MLSPPMLGQDGKPEYGRRVSSQGPPEGGLPPKSFCSFVGQSRPACRVGLGFGKMRRGRDELQAVLLHLRRARIPAASVCEIRLVPYHPKWCEMDRPMLRAPSESVPLLFWVSQK